MQISYKDRPHNKVDYYPLLNGYADVFLHKNERTETDEEGNTQYVADEVYFQIEQSVTKEQIEKNFENIWNNVVKEKEAEDPALEERIKAIEDAVLFLLTGGI